MYHLTKCIALSNTCIEKKQEQKDRTSPPRNTLVILPRVLQYLQCMYVCIVLGNKCIKLYIEETRAKKVEPPSLQYTCHIAPPTQNEQRATLPPSFSNSADKMKIHFHLDFF